MKTYEGGIKGKIIDVRFALSGKISRILKHSGDIVKQWDLLASLDRKILQTELDRQLADFEKVKADFEIFAGKVGEPTDEVNKYLKAEKQATLNGSVKDVELAKAKLDQSDLFSPVNGSVIDDGGIVVGVYITPSNTPIKILDSSSLYFEFEIEQKDVTEFNKIRKCKIDIVGIDEKINGETSLPFSDGKNISIKVKLAESPKLLLGMKGKIVFS